jgi:predicted anti-sigma-YlaC factor YlaD
MFSCRHATRLISDRQDRSVSWFDSTCLGVHLLGCEPCRRFRRAIRWLQRALRSAPSDDVLLPEARERIRLALERAAQDE